MEPANEKLPALRLMSLDALQPSDYNPRVVDEAALGRLTMSLAEFGNLQPITWNQRTGRIIAGHQRLVCLRAMGHTHTEVWVVDLAAPQEKAANLALNNYAGRFDAPRVRRMLEEIQEAKIQIPLTGFDEKAIAKLKQETAPKTVPIPAEKFEVVIECTDELEQKEVYERMLGEGRKCRLLTY